MDESDGSDAGQQRSEVNRIGEIAMKSFAIVALAAALALRPSPSIRLSSSMPMRAKSR